MSFFVDSFLLDTETLTNAITYQHITTFDKSYSQKDAKHCSVFSTRYTQLQP